MAECTHDGNTIEIGRHHREHQQAEVLGLMKRQKTVRPYCYRVSERERRDIVTALRNIVFLEDDETGDEYC